MRPAFRSILGRIAWLHVIVLGIASIITPLSAYFLLANTARVFEHQVLRSHADALARYVQFHDGHLTLALPADLQSFYAQASDGFSYAVRDSRGDLVATSGKTSELRGISAPRANYFENRKSNAIFFGAVFPKRIAGQTVFIEVGQNGAHPDVIVDDILLDFFRKVGWIMIPITLIVVAIDLLVIRRALKPVLTASDLARSIGPARLDVRLPVAKVPTEIRPLVQAFNDALDRLERGFQVQREFTADAAHELRTPLSILRSRIDTFPDQDAIRPLRRDVDVMTRIVGQLLEAAELEATTTDLHEILDLRTCCAKVLDDMAPIVGRRGQRVVLTGTTTPVLIEGNSDMIFRAIQNLVENAAKYSPATTTIEINVEDNGSISVIDEGPGIAEENRALIFQRFWRRDRNTTAGAGLGLSIVSKIVDLHRGRIAVESARDHGTKFILRFTPVAAVQ